MRHRIPLVSVASANYIKQSNKFDLILNCSYTRPFEGQGIVLAAKMEDELPPPYGVVLSNNSGNENPTLFPPPEYTSIRSSSPATSQLSTNSSLEQPSESSEESATEDLEAVEVEAVLDARTSAMGGMEYFLKWRGYDNSFNSWEPAENVNCDDLVASFLASRKDTKKGKGALTKHSNFDMGPVQDSAPQEKISFEASDEESSGSDSNDEPAHDDNKPSKIADTSKRNPNSDKLLYECELCNYSSLYRANRDKHAQMHVNTAKFTCSHCNYSTTTENKLEAHRTKDCYFNEPVSDGAEDSSANADAASAKGAKQCSHCRFRSSPANVAAHEQFHFKKFAFTCVCCNYSCKSRGGLQVRLACLVCLWLFVLMCFVCLLHDSSGIAVIASEPCSRRTKRMTNPPLIKNRSLTVTKKLSPKPNPSARSIRTRLSSRV